MPISTFSKTASPSLFVTAYSLTGKPEYEVPVSLNVKFSLNPSSAVFITFRLPFFRTLLKVTTAVSPVTTVTALLSCGMYLSSVSSVTVYLPGLRDENIISPFSFVFAVSSVPFPVILKLTPAITPSSDAFIILQAPGTISFTAFIVNFALPLFNVTLQTSLSYFL